MSNVRPDNGSNRLIGGLTKRVISASTWAIGTNAASQILRLASNLILSRLLFPGAFGTMAIVSSVLAGLEMFSDLGIGASIIRNSAPTSRFLDTLWSLQVVRGWALFAVSVLIAMPVAHWYGQPILLSLVPAAGLTSVIRGYAHTSQFTLNRELKLRQLFYLEVGSYAVTILISVIAAYEMRNVWALIIGAYAGSLTRCVLTYRLTDEPRPRWCWDRDVLQNIGGFTRWVLFSTMLTFITNQGNSLILGSFADLSFLGLYSIAAGIAGIASQVMVVLGERVFFPAYGHFGLETTPLLRRRIIKIRLAVMVMILPPLWVLICFGDWFIRLLWDTRYYGAGAMVQILCAGNLLMAFGVGPLYLARGESWIGFLYGALRAAFLLPALVIGGHLFGPLGLVGGIAVSRAIEYPVEIWTQRRYGVWVPWVDAIALGLSTLFIGLGFLLRHWLRS
jgi:O-antigen/teichoic acid export membrane protein